MAAVMQNTGKSKQHPPFAPGDIAYFAPQKILRLDIFSKTVKGLHAQMKNAKRMQKAIVCCGRIQGAHRGLLNVFQSLILRLIDNMFHNKLWNGDISINGIPDQRDFVPVIIHAASLPFKMQ